MNVLIISEYFPPDQGGASTRVSILIKELIKYHNVTIITCSPHYPNNEKSTLSFLKPIKKYYIKHASIIRIWIPSFKIESSIGRIVTYLWFTFSSIIGLTYSQKPDIIWSTSPNLFCGFTSKMARFFLGGKAIANVDDIWPEAPIELGFIKSPFLKYVSQKLAQFSVKNLDALTPISETISNYYCKKFGLKNVFTIPVGIESIRLKIFNDFQSKLSPHKAITKNVIFMYSGILGPAYDFKILLKAFLYLRNQPNIQLIIRGSGPKKTFIQKFIDKYELKNVSLETGYLTTEELNRKLLTADVFVLPMVNNFISKTALPTKLFEYMGIGKPIVVYGTGEPKKLVEKAQAGLICPNGNYKNFAKYLLLMANCSNEWEVFGKNGRNFVQQHYSSESIGNYVNEMFLSIKQQTLKIDSKSGNPHE